MDHPCTVCSKTVTARSKALSCDDCLLWTHVKCTGYVTNDLYNSYIQKESAGESFNFYCNRCSLAYLPGTMDSNIDEQDYTHSFSTQAPSEADESKFECFTRKGMHFLHLNSRSLLPKISEIRLLAEKSRAAVIAITETWLDNTISDSEVSIDGYSLIRKDRNRNGGGVCIYIMNRYAFNRREDISSSEDELLWAEIHLPKSRPIVVGVCYRPPKQSDFCARLEETLSKIRSDCETIVLGDMNICFTHKSSQLFKMYNNVLQLFNFEQIIDTPYQNFM